VGGAGLAILNRLMEAGMPGAEFLAISTDAASLAGSTAPHRLLLESKRLRGLGTGGDPGRGAKAAEENLSRLKPLCQGADLVFLVSGLGGGTGSGVSPVVARLARQAGALVTGFVVLPFACEGEARGLNAARALEALKAAADGVICLPNEKIFKLINEDSSVAETFDKAGGLLADGVQAVWRLIHLRGPIELNFEDLSAVLRDRHSENLFAVAEGSGAERVTGVLERLRAHPLLDGGKDLERADSLLVSVVSGTELTMAEINRLMAEINGGCPRARVAMGVATSPEYSGRLVVTLIASCRGGSALRESAPAESSGRVPSEPGSAADELFPRLLGDPGGQRPSGSRCIPPPPEIAPDRIEQLAARKGVRRKPSSRLHQGQLPLEVVSKGRFDKGEPTVLHGEDLDMPTYVRRGVSLN
ncbi:MAG: cell division FtsZ family protein, partial [Verrucomicrobia bacterium]|nr:cell division FtsZ family protein [Verrucomicrobiota bacterium]